MLDKIMPYIGYIKIAAILLTLAGLFASEKSFEHHLIDKGRHEQKSIDDIELAKINTQNALALADQRDELLKAIKERDTKLAGVDEKYQKEKEDAQSTINHLSADLRDGKLRLSVAIRSIRSLSTNGNGGAAGEPEIQARAELDGATSEALVRIAADGDDAIRERNECIERYEIERQSINKINIK